MTSVAVLLQNSPNQFTINSETAQRKLDGSCNSFGPGFWAWPRGNCTPLFPRLDAEGKPLSEEFDMTREERKEYAAAWRARNPERLAVYREKNRLRMAAWRASEDGKAAMARLCATPEYKAKKARYRVENLDKIREWMRAYYARPNVLERQKKRQAERYSTPEKVQAARARSRTHYQAPGVKERGLARRKVRYASLPAFNLKLRMSAAIRYSLKGTGKPSKWLDLVGYTVADLRAHLERQFLPKMGWHNMPKWHIDHIVPLASFTFASAEDPEFKAAWALTNLRPVWASTNLAKRDKREYLL